MAQPAGPIAVRGNVFLLYFHGISSCANCQMPVQKMISVSGRSMDQDSAGESITIRSIRGHEALVDQFKQLEVKSRM
eukprot:6188975-Karenia_brevis.AAC.1